MTQNFASDGDRTRDRLSPDGPTHSRRRPYRSATEDARFKLDPRQRQNISISSRFIDIKSVFGGHFEFLPPNRK